MRVLFPAVLLAALIYGLHIPVSGSFQAGPMLEPVDGLWKTARLAKPWQSETIKLDGMQDSVRVEMDERGVPHINASSDLDAMAALGYTVVRDRLFEVDFIHRVSTGRLSDLLGSAALRIDRHFHETGIVDAVRRNTELLPNRMPREYEAVLAYMQGANTWLATLDPSAYPLEYRLLGAEPPQELTPEHTMALYAYMAYDLSFRNSDRRHSQTQAALGNEVYQQLFPEFSTWEIPIIREEEGNWGPGGFTAADRESAPTSAAVSASSMSVTDSPRVDHARTNPEAGQSTYSTEALSIPMAEGFIEGKGSNNWAVSGSRSVTGMPILAGDMHLTLSLPAIWYEAHMITPTTNVYGVTFPAVPGIVEGITPTIAWAFTNTGSDQLDTYRIQLNAERTQYFFDGTWRDLEIKTDTIRVKDADPVPITIPYTHFGPVQQLDEGDFVIRWVGHEFGTTFAAIWDMNRATNYEEFELATRQWDYPMQNILYAGRDSVIAIRSTGLLPIRGHGNAHGVLDGTTSDTEWIGRVPFNELPHVVEPAKGYLASTNQRPAPEGYPHYLGQDWRAVFRSVRIDELLSSKQRHSADDLALYQSDQKAVQVTHFVAPLDSLEDLSEGAERMRRRLQAFDGVMSVESTDARLFDWYYNALWREMWDEDVFWSGVAPKDVRILELAQSDPEHVWFDRVDTPERETAADVFRGALENAAEQWADDDYADVPWGEVQTLQMQHITGAEPLRALWRENMPFGGYRETLSPSRTNPVRFSASWRVVVDFATSPPQARGIYPGGQSGNPFSTLYDAHIQKFLDFDYYAIDLTTGL